MAGINPKPKKKPKRDDSDIIGKALGKKQGGGRSLLGQVTDLTTGVFSGIAHVAGSGWRTADSAVNDAYMSARGLVTDPVKAITRPQDDPLLRMPTPEEREKRYPLVEETRASLSRTGGRVVDLGSVPFGRQGLGQTKYAQAVRESGIVGAVVEDVANASLILSPAGKFLTAAGRAADAGRFAKAGSIADVAAGVEAVRPGYLSRTGSFLTEASHLGAQAGMAPAKIWTAVPKYGAEAIRAGGRLTGFEAAARLPTFVEGAVRTGEAVAARFPEIEQQFPRLTARGRDVASIIREGRGEMGEVTRDARIALEESEAASMPSRAAARSILEEQLPAGEHVTRRGIKATRQEEARIAQQAGAMIREGTAQPLTYLPDDIAGDVMAEMVTGKLTPEQAEAYGIHPRAAETARSYLKGTLPEEARVRVERSMEPMARMGRERQEAALARGTVHPEQLGYDYLRPPGPEGFARQQALADELHAVYTEHVQRTGAENVTLAELYPEMKRRAEAATGEEYTREMFGADVHAMAEAEIAGTRGGAPMTLTGSTGHTQAGPRETVPVAAARVAAPVPEPVVAPVAVPEPVAAPKLAPVDPTYKPSNVRIVENPDNPSARFVVHDYDGTPMRGFKTRAEAEAAQRTRRGVIKGALTKRAAKAKAAQAEAAQAEAVIPPPPEPVAAPLPEPVGANAATATARVRPLPRSTVTTETTAWTRPSYYGIRFGDETNVPARLRPTMAASERVHTHLLERAADETLDPLDRQIAQQMADEIPRTLDEFAEHASARGEAGLRGDYEHLISGGASKTASRKGQGGPFARRVKRFGEQTQAEKTMTQRGAREQSILDAQRRGEFIRDKTAADIGGKYGKNPNDIPGIDTSMKPAALEKAMNDAGYEKLSLGGGEVAWVEPAIKAAFDREWKDPGQQFGMKLLSRANRGWKMSVLPLSPRWHMGNIVGNALMGTIGAGIDPITLAQSFYKVRNEMKYGDPRAFPGRLTTSSLAAGEARTMFGERAAGEGNMLQRGIAKSYDFNTTVDEMFRSAVYIAKKGEGYTDEAAIGQALKAMGDFDKMTPFERNTVREILPFYSWARHITQLTLRLPVEHPMRVSWMLHLADQYGDDQSVLPKFLRGSAQIGGRYLPGSSLNPFSDLERSPFASAIGFGAATTPFIKVPIQMTTGIDLSRGFNQTTRSEAMGGRNARGTLTPGMMPLNALPNLVVNQIPLARLARDVIPLPGVESWGTPGARLGSGEPYMEGPRRVGQVGRGEAVARALLPWPRVVSQEEINAATRRRR